MEKLLAPYILAFVWASILIPLGVLIRARVPFFQRFAVPSSLIAGFLGLAAINLGLVGYPSLDGWVRIDFKVFQGLTNVFFALNFTLIGLSALKGKSEGGGGLGKEVVRGAIWIGLVYSAVYMGQLIIGVGVVAAWNLVTGATLETASGFLVGIGFAGGPGSAIAYGTVWEKAGMNDLVAVGVTYAAMGYVVAAAIGVPIANWGIRKGLAAAGGGKLDSSFISGLMEKTRNQSIGRQVTHSSSLDSLTFHVAIGMVAFGVSWVICYLLKHMVLPKSMGAITFDMIYVWGLFGGILTRFVLNRLGGSHLVDGPTLNRLIGVCVDYVIVCCLLSVQLDAVARYAGPIVITVVLVAAFTAITIAWFSMKLGSLGLERFLATFGMITGTIANSMVLLRIVDPEYETTTAVEVGLSNTIQLFTLLPLYVIYAMMPSAAWLGVFGLTKVIFAHAAIFLLLILILHRIYFKRSFAPGI